MDSSKFTFIAFLMVQKKSNRNQRQSIFLVEITQLFKIGRTEKNCKSFKILSRQKSRRDVSISPR
jgi:hypothetical protein